jgi:hypothetical protein
MVDFLLQCHENRKKIRDFDMEDRFIPQSFARNPHIQTIFASLKLRAMGKHTLFSAATEMTIEAGNGARLLGYYSRHLNNPSIGLITLIHGWEGSSDSTYVISTGYYFYKKGYDIFRLNLRDHGPSHHLNEGLFHGVLLEETFNAVSRVAEFSKDKPYYLIGFSLGGNFAMRVARKYSDTSIPNLKHVFSISPALDPYKSTLAIDRSPALYRYYFLSKWKQSLKKKQSAFPKIYDFNEALKLDTVLGITEAIMCYYPDFPTYRDYFNHYTLRADMFSHLQIPLTLIASTDDPILPKEDILTLKENHYLHLSIQQYGGHCGFLRPFPHGCWYERKIDDILQHGVEKNQG